MRILIPGALLVAAVCADCVALIRDELDNADVQWERSHSLTDNRLSASGSERLAQA